MLKMNYKIPNLKKILKTKWAHDVGFGFKKSEKVKIGALEQGTTPKDKNLLKKFGIKEKDKVLAIAGYYASWAQSLQKAGAKVDYSDISKEIVNWVKKNVKTKFGNYIFSNYELIPEKPNEYDWTFTYEACGGGRGLPIAYLRSLLNSKGGILVINLGDKKHQMANASKIKKYPNIAKTISRIYGSKSFVVKKQINAHKRGEKQIKTYKFLISKIKTNNSARKKATSDLKVLDYLNNKTIIDLEKDSKKLNISKKELIISIKRLDKFSKLVSAKGCVKKIKIKK